MAENKMSNLTEDLFDAMTIITKEIIKGISFDQTKICTITDDSNSKNGEYEVSDGTLTYIAKSENTTYKKDEQVRVAIMNGDMNADKYIIGKFGTSSDKPISYISPLNKVLDMTGNLIPANDASLIQKLVANSPITKVTLYQQNIENYYDTKLYDTLYVSANFKSLLSDANIKSGNYGLAIKLGEQRENGVAELRLCLDSSNMFGDPYAFSFFSEQAMCFDITSLENIAYIQVEFYQDNNFITQDDTRLALKPLSSGELVPNLLIQNINVGLGSNLDKFTDNTVKLYTNDSLTYNQKDPTSTTKNLRFAWYNKDENNKYLGFSDGLCAPEYDEITQYILPNKALLRLRAQESSDMPKDENALRIAAEVREVRPLVEKIASLFKSKLGIKLTNFANSFTKLTSQKAAFDRALKNINDAAIELNQLIKELYDYYFEVFKYASQYNALPETIGKPATAPVYEAVDQKNIAFSTIQNKYTAILEEVQLLLEDIKTEVEKTENGKAVNASLQGDYDYHAKQLKSVIDEIEKLIASIGGIWADLQPEPREKTNDELVEIYRNKPEKVYDFQVPNLSTDTANRYCVYWYRYDAAAPGDEVMPAGWVQIDKSKNVGLPTEDPNKTGYLAVSPIFEDAALTINDLDAKTKSEERFVVVVFYNHAMYKSNELVFKNDDIITDKSLVSLSDRIVIKHGDHSKDVYQDYSITNTLLNQGEMFTPRKLSIDFITADGVLTNSALIDAQIYWYIPAQSSMLDYELSELGSFKNDLDSPELSAHSKQGYACFYKTIKSKEGSDPEKPEVDENDLVFSYHITNYYAPMLSQNTILCKVVQVIDDKTYTYETEMPLTFASYGTSGTDYTLVVAPVGRAAAVSPEHPLDFNISLYDSNNELIPFTEASKPTVIQWPRGNTLEVSVDEKTGLAKVQVAKTIDESINPYQGILIVKAKAVYNDQTIQLTRYYPIPWAAETNYYIEGADSVVYNSQGTNPTFYRSPYVLYTRDLKPVNDITWRIDHYNKNTNKWLVSEIAKSSDGDDFIVDKNFLPSLDKEKNILCPCGMYIDLADGEELSPWVSYVSAEQKADAYSVWMQPIVILQNRHPSPMLNAWDGSFEINEENGTIMSTMLGAGRKTKTNQFEGILVGDIREGAGIFDYNNQTGLGIYGFNNGAQSFGFNIDGTAFIGKSGRGRILFDGNSGQIASASYMQTVAEPTEDAKSNNRVTPITNPTTGQVTGYKPNINTRVGDFQVSSGTVIDLDDGYIDMRGVQIKEDKVTYEKGQYDEYSKIPSPTLPEGEEANMPPADNWTADPVDPVNPDKNNLLPYQSRILFDVKSPYARITSIRGKDLLYIGDGAQFIKSDNYIKGKYDWTDPSVSDATPAEEIPGYGMKIDLYQGQIDAYNLKVSSKNVMIDSTRNATNHFIVRDHNDKHLIHMGAAPIQGEDNSNLENRWYLQSSNYLLPEIDIIKNDGISEEHMRKPGAGMKIDLGAGRLMSNTLLINGSPKEDEPFFEIKAKNPDNTKDTTKDKLYSIFTVTSKQATLSGWTIDNNSIRIGTLGDDKSMWLCCDGSRASAIEGFVGNKFSNGDEYKERGWCIAVGKNFGVDKNGVVYMRGARILGGELWLGENPEKPATKLDSYGNLCIGDNKFIVNASGDLFIGGSQTKNEDNKLIATDALFTVNASGYMEAKSGQIGVDLSSGMIFIHGKDYGDATEAAGSVFFVRDDSEDANGIMDSLSEMVGNVRNNNFYLGTGGLIIRSNNGMVEQYRGISLSGDGLYVDGCRNEDQQRYGHRSWLSGDGLAFYQDSNIFEGYDGTEIGFIGIERNTQNKDVLQIDATSLGMQLTGDYVNIDASKINLSSGDTSIENLIELNGETIGSNWVSDINKLITLLNGKYTGTVTLVDSVWNYQYNATAQGTGTVTVDGKTGTCEVSVPYIYYGAAASTKILTISNGIITDIT